MPRAVFFRFPRPVQDLGHIRHFPAQKSILHIVRVLFEAMHVAHGLFRNLEQTTALLGNDVGGGPRHARKGDDQRHLNLIADATGQPQRVNDHLVLGQELDEVRSTKRSGILILLAP